jgi:hypothetical protein
LGPLLPELVIRQHDATLHIAWMISTGLTWLFIAGCAAAVWVAGYGMGYRRGVKDALYSSSPKTDHRLNGD